MVHEADGLSFHVCGTHPLLCKTMLHCKALLPWHNQLADLDLHTPLYERLPLWCTRRWKFLRRQLMRCPLQQLTVQATAVTVLACRGNTPGFCLRPLIVSETPVATNPALLLWTCLVSST